MGEIMRDMEPSLEPPGHGCDLKDEKKQRMHWRFGDGLWWFMMVYDGITRIPNYLTIWWEICIGQIKVLRSKSL
jgi:hypothetical protein